MWTHAHILFLMVKLVDKKWMCNSKMHIGGKKNPGGARSMRLCGPAGADATFKILIGIACFQARFFRSINLS